MIGLVGCTARAPALDWISDSAAVVHCIGVGPDAARPTIHDELPTVEVPAQFFLRAMAPEDLSDIGFAPNTAVCAALLPYPWIEIDRMETGMKEIRGVLDEMTVQLRKGDACFCSQLRGLDAQWITPACSRERVRLGCNNQDIIAQRALAPKLEAVRELAGSLEIPLEHWRLAGRTDRPGFWEHRYRWLKRRFHGAVEAFEPSFPATTGPSMLLINRLLEAPGVVMVVRQNGGRSVLVVREPEKGALVFDLFRKPVYENESLNLLHKLDDLKPEIYLNALAKPTSKMKLPGDLRRSFTTWMSRDGLERVDAATRAIAYFFQLPSLKIVDEEVEPLVASMLWTTSIREGENPSSSEVKLSLTEEGVAWVATLRDEGFSQKIYDLAEPEEQRESPIFEAMAAAHGVTGAWAGDGDAAQADSGEEQALEGSGARGSRPSIPTFAASAVRDLDIGLTLDPNIDGVWFHGLRRAVLFLSAAEFKYTATFTGSIDSWILKVPGAFRLGDLRVVSAFRPTMSRLGGSAHVLEGGVEKDGAALWIRLRRP